MIKKDNLEESICPEKIETRKLLHTIFIMVLTLNLIYTVYYQNKDVVIGC